MRAAILSQGKLHKKMKKEAGSAKEVLNLKALGFFVVFCSAWKSAQHHSLLPSQVQTAARCEQTALCS